MVHPKVPVPFGLGGETLYYIFFQMLLDADSLGNCGGGNCKRGWYSRFRKSMRSGRVSKNFSLSVTVLHLEGIAILKQSHNWIKMKTGDGDMIGRRDNKATSECLRAREIITSHFRIPPSGHLGPIFIYTILSVGLGYACGCAPSDRPNLP